MENKKYGVLIGRFQPLTLAHQKIIETIKKQNLEPVIIVGSKNKINDKNPLSFKQRKKMIKRVYPDLKVIGLEDFYDWDEWFANVEKVFNQFSKNPKEEIVFFTHLKPEDKQDFIFKNETFYYENYQVIFKNEGYDLFELDQIHDDGVCIHATHSRKCEITAKKHLSEKVYEYLKSIHFWGKTLFKDKYTEIVEYPQVIKCYGGDGTLLRAINKFRHKNKVFYGVARGRVNFLMNENEESGNYHILHLNLLEAEIRNKTYYAFNDICIGGDMNSWIHFEVNDRNNIFDEFSGGGLIFSTAQGSTGINKNNGGVILPIDSKNIVVTGDKTNRKIHYVLEPQYIEIRMNSRDSIKVWVDGKNNIIDDVEYIKIKTSEESVKIAIDNIEEFLSKRRI